MAVYPRDFKKSGPPVRMDGTTSTTLCVGNDSRLSDSRAPSGAAGGDLTGTYPSPTIASSAVTYAKIQNVSATNRLLGRSTAGAGVIEELTPSTGLTLSGGNLTVSYGTSSSTACVGNDNRLLAGSPEGNTHIFEAAPGLGYSTGFKGTANTAYWVYLGRFPVATTIAYIRTLLTVNGTGLTSMSVCVASGSAAPNGNNITMTKIAGTASFDDLTTGAPKLVKNSSSLGASVTAGTHVYIGMNANYATTMPTFIALIRDNGLGRLLSTATAGSLAGAGPWTAVPIAFVADATTQAPRMYATDF